MIRAMPLLLLLACTPGIDVTVSSRSPVVQIETPVDGVRIRSGDYGFIGRVTDVDDDILHLVATWRIHSASGWRVACRSYPEADGTTRCLTTVFDMDDAVSLEGVDLAGYQDVAVVGLDVATAYPPEITWLAPDVAYGPYYANVPVVVNASIRDEDDPPSAWSIYWHSSIQGALDGPMLADSYGDVHGALTLIAGTHRLTVRVRDAGGAERAMERVVVVRTANQQPSCRWALPIDGQVVGTGEPVSLVGYLSDADVAATRLLAQWSSDLDGTLGSTSPNASTQVRLDGVRLSRGHHLLTMKGIDEVGAFCEHARSVHVDDRPVLTLVAPVADQVIPYATPLHVQGRAVDSDLGPTAQLHIQVTSNRTGLVGSGLVRADGTFDVVVQLGGGAQTLRVEVTDEFGLTDFLERDVEVVLP